MNQSPKLRVDLFDVAARLKALGLSVDTLRDTISAGYQGWVSCPEIDPPMYAGLTMWALMVRRLRQRLLLEGWTYSDEGNYSTVMSPSKEIALAIATGDENTGRNTAIQPTTQSPKGPRTADAVYINSGQLSLNLSPSTGQIQTNRYELNEQPDATTWILLVHRVDCVVYSELSHPLDLDENQRVCGWHERIILPPSEFSPDENINLNGNDGNDTGDIDIPVLRRL